MDDGEAVTIRLAGADDVAVVRSIVSEAYEPYVERIGRQPAPMLADDDDLVRRGAVHLATSGGRVVGLVVLWAEADHLHVDNVATARDVRGLGIGSALLALADEEARRRHLTEVRLFTNVAMVENLDYYPRRGYRETHRATEDGYQRAYFSREVPPRP